MRLERVAFRAYNFGPAGDKGRTPKVLAREQRALLNIEPRDRRQATVKVDAGVEAIGWGDLPDMPGYQLIRDRSTEPRANLCLYLPNALEVEDVTWLRHHRVWRQTRDGAGPNDMHPPRRSLRVRVKGDDRKRARVYVVHAPPVTKHGDTGPARAEWVTILADDIAAADVPCIVPGDPNGLFPTLKRELADRDVQAVTGGDSTDGILVTGYTLHDTKPVARVNGVEMGSDHHKALRGRAVRRRDA
jgi:hypothetical protein